MFLRDSRYNKYVTIQSIIPNLVLGPNFKLVYYTVLLRIIAGSIKMALKRYSYNALVYNRS